MAVIRSVFSVPGGGLTHGRVAVALPYLSEGLGVKAIWLWGCWRTGYVDVFGVRGKGLA